VPYPTKGIGGVLNSLSMVVELVGGWTTESVTHGQCDARPIVTFPAAESHRLLGEQRNTCVNSLPRVVLWQ